MHLWGKVYGQETKNPKRRQAISKIHLNLFRNYNQVKVKKQWYEGEDLHIRIYMDKRFIPECHKCHVKVREVHSYQEREIRDIDIIKSRTHLVVRVRTLKCPSCGDVVEELGFVESGERITKRLKEYIYFLCMHISLSEVAEHLDLDWKEKGFYYCWEIQFIKWDREQRIDGDWIERKAQIFIDSWNYEVIGGG